MLTTKHLTKIYRPKKGVPVTALNDISLQFSDKGLVFLLGKSGSGKSTLLNILGGLDNYNSGEIFIQGVSSKSFSQKHLDSYRNTYIGFIFQEYNVLEEFTVGANIGLALELQGQKATDQLINQILDKVDLTGYGARKPNELSGGQKQRVAIARALVKNPQIIMADEPTGALDSSTGKQVLDTLKKLSADKLVIVVSHDREFAQNYADRIIELSDGEVISDTECVNESATQTSTPSSNLTYNQDTIEIASGYHLTEEDRLAINEYIDLHANEAVNLKVGESSSMQRKFVPTTIDDSIKNEGKFKLIKSRLPLGTSVKIGASSLKNKKIRLAITILLSCISFGLFGLSDTFGSYDHINTCTSSLIDTGITHASMSKARQYGSGSTKYWSTVDERISDNEVKSISSESGTKVNGVYIPIKNDMDFSNNIDTSISLSETDNSIFSTQFNGYMEINDSTMSSMDLKLVAGKLPNGNKNEIAISKFLCETFLRAKYKSANGQKFETISKPADLVGKTLTFNQKDFTITGIIDTNFNLERYLPLIKKPESNNVTTTDQIINFALSNEFSYEFSSGIICLAFVGDGATDRISANEPNISQLTSKNIYISTEILDISPMYVTTLNNLATEKIEWLDGPQDVLKDNEILVSSDVLYDVMNETTPETIEEAKELLKNNRTISMNTYDNNKDTDSSTDVNIVGIIDTLSNESQIKSTIAFSDNVAKSYDIAPDGKYAFVIGPMPTERSEVKKLVSYSYREDTKLRYQLLNSVTYELDTINELLNILSTVFLYIGIGFAVFSALMLMNYISTSISYKKQEIGILRAIGARSNDVFRIFFSESFIIALTNFVLSTAGVLIVTLIINNVIRDHYGLLITVLNFGIRQIALLLGISVLVAVVASAIPVYRIASKRPIDAIRNR